MSKKQTSVQKPTTRPPVVTILGHVDHGKTTLLDFIRKANVAAKEAGGITQHTSAYQVDIGGKKITFIDTPGHAAFSAMRSRGAAVNDISILVVAADDGVMPQTKESISHIKASSTPMIVAINKMDTAGANIERVKKGLATEGVLVEGYGGDVVAVPLSAKTGEGVKELLEMILLVADLEELKDESKEDLEAVVIDSSLDRFKGPSALVLVKKGILKLGDQVFVGTTGGKVKSLISTAGERLKEAGPSTTVEVLGLSATPAVGEVMKIGTASPKQAVERQERNPFEQAQSKEIRLILKADTAGSLEAIEAAISSFETSTGKVKIVHRETGEVNDSDIALATATKALVVAFNVSVSKTIGALAKEDKVLIRHYNLIYELLDELKEGVDALLNVKQEEVVGRAEVIATFKADQARVAGCRVLEGRISRTGKVNILRDERKIGVANVKSMKHLQEEINSASKDQEFGMVLEGKADFAIGDIIEA